MKRRDFVFSTLAGISLLPACARVQENASEESPNRDEPPSVGNPLFWVKNIPASPFAAGPDSHAGIDALIRLMGRNGMKFYRSPVSGPDRGPWGMIDANDVVLVKVNAQWKYRGCTNSDLVRGLIRRVLDHPDGFNGEVVIVENGQGRGSLRCDTRSSYGGSAEVHANANDESHHFLYLVDTVFRDSRVSAFLLDPLRSTFIPDGDHATNGYRKHENVSYPCFTTAKGNRVELREGIWTGSGYTQNLKLINVPVLKHHDTGGSEITASLKHFYGLVSMADGSSGFRHYSGLGETCGKMIVSVRAPVLNIIDAIWVSQGSIAGFPESTTTRVNQIMAGQDPVALDFYAAKHVLYPINNDSRHHPDFSGIRKWLTDACGTITLGGGIYNPDRGILVKTVTQTETDIQVFTEDLS